MEDNAKLIESLLERATEYGKASFELIKLKALDKSSEAFSSFVPQAVVVFFILVFMLFLNLGLSLWIGEILGRTFYGFFVVAAFYGIAGIIFHLFIRDKLKRNIANYFIKHVLK